MSYKGAKITVYIRCLQVHIIVEVFCCPIIYLTFDVWPMMMCF